MKHAVLADKDPDMSSERGSRVIEKNQIKRSVPLDHEGVLLVLPQLARAKVGYSSSEVSEHCISKALTIGEALPFQERAGKAGSVVARRPHPSGNLDGSRATISSCRTREVYFSTCLSFSAASSGSRNNVSRSTLRSLTCAS